MALFRLRNMPALRNTAARKYAPQLLNSSLQQGFQRLLRGFERRGRLFRFGDPHRELVHRTGEQIGECIR